MKNNRIGWIDAAKGIAMFLVVLGHNPLPPAAVRIIYCLNVPIFFLMSGYTFRTEKYSSIWELAKVLARRVVLPYVLMNCAAFGVFYWTRGLHPDLSGAKQLFLGMVYGVGDNGSLRFNIPLWFLPCLCVVQCFWYLIDRYGKKAKTFWILLSSVIGYFIFALVQVRLPWGIDVAFTGLVFFALGNFFRKEQLENALFRIPSVLGFVVMMGCNVGFNVLNKSAYPNVDINSMIFGNFFLFYICSVSGCIAIVYLARLFQWSRILRYIGRNTLWVLGLHSLFIQLFELKMKLVLTEFTPINSLILCVLEIACVAVIKCLYDMICRFFSARRTKSEIA